MTNSSLVCVLTTIQPPTACVRRLAEVLGRTDSRLIVIGDRKGPANYPLPGADFFSLSEQRRLPFRLAALLPVGHYARKNLGYLLAAARGAACLYETDDDNAPAAGWQPRHRTVRAQPVAARPWMNVYRAFAADDQLIWPRGFPLEAVTDPATATHDPQTPRCAVDAPVQQGLADLAPDVDAVWRLLAGRDYWFAAGRSSLYLPPGTWCPFNSQTTWWWPDAYPLLYLPSHCSFRMTDIWRSFVAQRCLWEFGGGLVFHGPEVVQERNPHNLLGDFRDEVSGYLNNGRLMQTLADLTLRPGPGAVLDNLVCCYETLIAGGFLPAEERPLVHAWAADVEAVSENLPGRLVRDRATCWRAARRKLAGKSLSPAVHGRAFLPAGPMA